MGTKTIRLSGLLPCKQARHQFYAVGGLGSNDYTVDRTPLGREQSFHLLIGAACRRDIRSRETQRVEKAKAFDKEGESEAVYALRR
jgi:hypothetical protein